RWRGAMREVVGGAREFQRRPDELFTQRAGGSGVVSGAAVRPLLPERFEGLSAVREARRQDGTVAHGVVAGEFFLHYETERVSLLQGEEIDVPLKHVDQLLRELWPFARRAQRFVKRAVDVRRD